MNVPQRRCEVGLADARIVLVGTIQGLAGEARHVQQAWDSFGPEGASIIALGVPPEDVRNLQRIGREGVAAFMAEELDTGSYEESFLPQLSRFGDIAMPPDDLLLAEELSRRHGRPLVGLDLDDEAHADLYTESVGGIEMLRSQMRLKKLVGKRAEAASTPEELVLLWDSTFMALKGHRKMEEERERVMAERIRALAGEHPRLLVVVALARMEGVAELLGSRSLG